MSTQTGGDLNLVKPELTDDHKVTIGTDLPANFQKIDDEFSAHLADTASHNNNGQLIFPATQNPSSSPNVLDDYEEGTWTPIIAATDGLFTSVTYDSEVYGLYTKIGNICHIQGYIKTDAINKGATVGAITISGFPYASSKNTSLSLGVTSNWNTNNPDSMLMLGTVTVALLRYRATSNGPALDLTNGNINTGENANEIHFNGSYRVA